MDHRRATTKKLESADTNLIHNNKTTIQNSRALGINKFSTGSGAAAATSYNNQSSYSNIPPKGITISSLGGKQSKSVVKASTKGKISR